MATSYAKHCGCKSHSSKNVSRVLLQQPGSLRLNSARTLPVPRQQVEKSCRQQPAHTTLTQCSAGSCRSRLISLHKPEGVCVSTIQLAHRLPHSFGAGSASCATRIGTFSQPMSSTTVRSPTRCFLVRPGCKTINPWSWFSVAACEPGSSIRSACQASKKKKKAHALGAPNKRRQVSKGPTAQHKKKKRNEGARGGGDPDSDNPECGRPERKAKRPEYYF